MATPTDSSRSFVYGLLLTIAVGAMLARIMAAERVYEPSLNRDEKDPNDRRSRWPKERPAPMPTFSSNDRSRWATVRALVDEGTYVIGKRDPQAFFGSAMLPLGTLNPLQAAAMAHVGYQVRIGSDSGIIFEDGWQSVDKVLHPSRLEFFSSKPPLLATLIAGLYWILQQLLGWTLTAHPQEVVRTILVLVNVVPFLIYIALLIRLVERWGSTDWGRFFVIAAACFATLVTPFALTLNNHSLATFSVLFALYSVIRIWEEGGRPGLFERGKLQPLGATRYHYVLAGLWSSFAVCNELPAAAFAAAVFVMLLWWQPRRTVVFFLPAALVPIAGLFVTNYLAIEQFKPAYAEFGGPWYEFEGSHWQKPPPGKTKDGIDWARFKETRLEYAFHLLLGHHGLFSLTPLWLLALAGIFLTRKQTHSESGPWPVDPIADPPGSPWFLPPLTLVLTVVVVGFYLVKSDNYGGWTVGPRWLMWLSPLWLLCLIPAADKLSACRRGRGLGYVLLGVSIFSAHYPGWNAWRMPWIYDLLLRLGWPGY